MKTLLRLGLIALLSAWIPLEAEDILLDATASSLKFTGHAFMHDFTGTASLFHGTAQIDPQMPQVVTGAKIVIGTANLTTFENTRDKNMRNWLQVKTNPEIVFVLQNVTPVQSPNEAVVPPTPASATKGQPMFFSVKGNLTLHQATHAVETQVHGWREGPWLVVAGTTSINTGDYGLPKVQQFFLTVDKKVDITFRLAFTLPLELHLAAAPK